MTKLVNSDYLFANLWRDKTMVHCIIIWLLCFTPISAQTDVINGLAKYRAFLMERDVQKMYVFNEIMLELGGTNQDVDTKKNMMMLLRNFIRNESVYDSINHQYVINLETAKYYKFPAIIKPSWVEAIYENAYLIDLILEGVVSDKYPFPLIKKENLQKELEFYDFKNGERIGEIGAGNGTFCALIMSSFPDCILYVNEHNASLLEYFKTKLTDLQILMPNVKSHFILGSDTSTMMEGAQLDKVIIRNTFHHFDKKEEMIASVRASIRKGGILYITESLKNSTKVFWHCHQLLSRKKIMKYFKGDKFKLIAENRIDGNLLLTYEAI